MIAETIAQIEAQLPQFIKPAGSPAKSTSKDVRDILTKILRRLDIAVKSGPLTPLEYGAIADGTSHPVSEWIGAGKPYATLAALKVDYPHVTATTDEIDWAAIQKACDVAYGVVAPLKRKMVFLPNGAYVSNRTITTGHEVALVGEHRSSATIRAIGTWDPDAPMVQLSRGGIDYEHANRIESLGLNCDNKAYKGVKAFNINENGGLYDCEILMYKTRGAEFKRRPVGTTGRENDTLINYKIHDCHIQTYYALDGAIGIELGDGHNHAMELSRITVGMARSDGGAPQAPGIVCAGGDVSYIKITNSHFESCLAGIRVDSGRVIADNVDALDNCMYTVHCTTGAAYALIRNSSCRNFTTGYVVKDDNDGANTIYIGRPFLDRSYVNKRARVPENMWPISWSANYDASVLGYRIPHGLPVFPAVASFSVNSNDLGTLLSVHVVQVNSTEVIVRVTNGGTPVSSGQYAFLGFVAF